MSSKKQKQAGHLIPDQITGHTLKCVSFDFPDDPRYLAALLGQITELCKWWNWEKTYEPGDTRATQAAQYMRDVLLTQPLFGGCETMFDVRQNPENGCQLQKTEDGELWVTFANLRLCKPRLRIGANGTIQWYDPVGETWQELEDPAQSPQEVTPTNEPGYQPGGDPQCQSAVAIEMGIKGVMAQIYGAALIGGAITSVIAALGAGLTALFTGGLLAPISDAIASAAAGIVSNWGLDFGDQLLAYDWKRFRCFIYDRMPADGIITQAAYDTIAADLDDEQGTVPTIINIVWDLVGLNGVISMMNQEAPNVNPAEPCCAGTFFFGEPVRKTILASYPRIGGFGVSFLIDNVPYKIVGFRLRIIDGGTYNGATTQIGHDNYNAPTGYEALVLGGSWTIPLTPGRWYIYICSQYLDNTPPTAPNTEAAAVELIGDYVFQPNTYQTTYSPLQADGYIAAGQNWFQSFLYADQSTAYGEIELTPICAS